MKLIISNIFHNNIPDNFNLTKDNFSSEEHNHLCIFLREILELEF